MKTFVIWLTKSRKVYMESTSFTNVMLKLLSSDDGRLPYFETEIKRIYCIDDDRSLVFYNNVSEGRKNG
nr:MAG TPA: hypothetical protein [Caudoviricetes sp.]